MRRAWAIPILLLVALTSRPAAGKTGLSIRCLGRDATILGTPGNDRLVTRHAGDVVAGLGGNDVIIATDPRAVLCGGAGDDSIRGVLTHKGYSRLVGGSGNDDLAAGEADYGSAPRGILVDLAAGTVTGMGIDVLRDVPSVAGTRFDDSFSSSASDRGVVTFAGREGRDQLIGGASRDRLFGGRGADVLSGGANFDFVDGGRGADIMEGGADADAVSFGRSSAGVLVDLTQASARGAGRDAVRGFESIYGSPRRDRLIGTSQANSIWGLGGDDVIEGLGGWDALRGQSGSDAVAGGHGADVVRGAGGRDLLVGGRGIDSLAGGAGRDRCIGGEDLGGCS